MVTKKNVVTPNNVVPQNTFYHKYFIHQCFPALVSLENKMQMIPLEAFYSGLGLHIDTVPAVQVFKTDLYRVGLSPSSLLTRSLPVVVMVVVSGSL